MSVFSVLAVVIATGVGTALTVELDEWSATLDAQPSRDFERPIFLPFWGLVGYLNNVKLSEQSGSSHPAVFVFTGLLVFLYLVAVIVLVNLMIAAMAQTYQRVLEDSTLCKPSVRVRVRLNTL